jgi:cyclopropane fatty-acyl-phospholipid synthase-like methyltransferase
MTAAEWLGFADRLGLRPESHVLEVGSGSGGPAVYLAEMRACRVTGVDINPNGTRNAERLAGARHIGDRVAFFAVDARKRLPFDDAAFDAIVSNDAMCHIPERLEALRDWHRLLRAGGTMLFTDAMIVTGPVTNEELATRSSIGRYIFVPPGENERLIAAAGFRLVASDDLTPAAATIARRWRSAREQHGTALVEREGAENFHGLQRFLACVERLSEERRLSRYCYVAEKPA